MLYNEVNLNREDVSMLVSFSGKQHYKVAMSLGGVLPINKAQANYFITENCDLSVLAGVDVDVIESILNEAGLKGDYVMTKSNKWVRLKNIQDFYKALKLKYQL